MFESKPRAAVEKKESSTETGTITFTLTPWNVTEGLEQQQQQGDGVFWQRTQLHIIGYVKNFFSFNV